MKTQEELQQIFNSLNENEKFGISFGLYPVKLMALKLENEDYADLVGISQKKTGVVY